MYISTMCNIYIFVWNKCYCSLKRQSECVKTKKNQAKVNNVRSRSNIKYIALSPRSNLSVCLVTHVSCYNYQSATHVCFRLVVHRVALSLGSKTYHWSSRANLGRPAEAMCKVQIWSTAGQLKHLPAQYSFEYEPEVPSLCYTACIGFLKM